MDNDFGYGDILFQQDIKKEEALVLGNILQQLEAALLAILFSILFMHQNKKKAEGELNKKA